MPEDTAAPSDMETPPVPRLFAMKAVVIVMGLVLVAGFGFVVATLIARVTNLKSETQLVGPGGRFGITDVQIDKGDIVRSVNLTEDRMAVHMSGAQGEEIIIVNVKTGVELGRFRLRALTGLAANTKP